MKVKYFGKTVFAVDDSDIDILEKIKYFEPTILYSTSFYKVNDNVFYLKRDPNNSTPNVLFLYLVKGRGTRIETTQKDAIIFKDQTSWGDDIMGIITEVPEDEELIIGVWVRYDENSELGEYTLVVSKNGVIERFYVDLDSFITLRELERT